MPLLRRSNHHIPRLLFGTTVAIHQSLRRPWRSRARRSECLCGGSFEGFFENNLVSGIITTTLQNFGERIFKQAMGEDSAGFVVYNASVAAHLNNCNRRVSTKSGSQWRKRSRFRNSRSNNGADQISVTAPLGWPRQKLSWLLPEARRKLAVPNPRGVPTVTGLQVHSDLPNQRQVHDPIHLPFLPDRAFRIVPACLPVLRLALPCLNKNS